MLHSGASQSVTRHRKHSAVYWEPHLRESRALNGSCDRSPDRRSLLPLDAWKRKSCTGSPVRSNVASTSASLRHEGHHRARSGTRMIERSWLPPVALSGVASYHPKAYNRLTQRTWNTVIFLGRDLFDRPRNITVLHPRVCDRPETEP